MDEDVRKLVYLDYGEFMTRLSGVYITAEDVGTTLTDMATIFSKTRFTTCIPAELGFCAVLTLRRFWNTCYSNGSRGVSGIRSGI
jgi:glutamate dehydrogenase/leucine dehydrogenase